MAESAPPPGRNEGHDSPTTDQRRGGHVEQARHAESDQAIIDGHAV